jgi:hypothetical protein
MTYYQEHKEERLAYQRGYVARNKEKIADYQWNYYIKNRSSKRDYYSKWYYEKKRQTYEIDKLKREKEKAKKREENEGMKLVKRVVKPNGEIIETYKMI